MRRLIAGLTAPLLAAFLLSGCGGDEGSSADDTSSAESSPSAPTEDPTEEPSEAAADAPGAGTKYCELLGTDFATVFANIKGPEDVAAAIDIIKQIAEEAPAEVEKEWGSMQGALDQVENALTEAAQLQKEAQAGTVTKKELAEKTAKLTKEMEALNTPGNAKAGETVAKHANEYCGVSLG